VAAIDLAVVAVQVVVAAAAAVVTAVKRLIAFRGI
jgi:hypothetical protein